MNNLNSLIEQAVNKVSIEGGFARGFPPTNKNYGTAVKFPYGQKHFFFLNIFGHWMAFLRQKYITWHCLQADLLSSFRDDWYILVSFTFSLTYLLMSIYVCFVL